MELDYFFARSIHVPYNKEYFPKMRKSRQVSNLFLIFVYVNLCFVYSTLKMAQLCFNLLIHYKK